MRLTDKIWGTCLAAFSLFYGTCALFGYFPGESLGITMFANLAERFGTAKTGAGSILVGVVAAVWVLSSSQRQRRTATSGTQALRYVGSVTPREKRPFRFPALPQPISAISVVWAVFIFFGTLYLGIDIMDGQVPGVDSGVGWIEGPARFLADTSAKFGPTLTGLGVIFVGTVFALACLYSRSSSEWD